MAIIATHVGDFTNLGNDGGFGVKVLITGAAGLLGSAVVEAARQRGHQVVACDRAALDITQPESVRAVVAAERPELVVNCAGFTAVDAAETQPELAMAVNCEGARNVAQAAHGIGARMVHVSTDYVFDGESDRPYTPDDTPNPLGAYAQSKLAGEEAVRAVWDDAADGAGGLILRTGWLYGAGGKNFVDAMLRAGKARPEGVLTIVDDQTGGPTWTGSLAPALIALAEQGATGVLHLSDAGEATWLELACEAFRISAFAGELPSGVSSEAWGAPAQRPTYSVLDTAAANTQLGRAMPHWKDSLRSYLQPGATE